MPRQKQEAKIDLAIRSLLGRLTDFQLQSNDPEFLDVSEDLRHHIVEFKTTLKEQRKKASKEEKEKA